MKRSTMTICCSMFFVLIMQKAGADTVEIINKTPVDLFVAVYYSQKTHTRVTDPVSIPSQKKVTIMRPTRKVNTDRNVYFSPDPAMLTSELSRGEGQFIPFFNIGTLQGSTYYILFHEGVFKGYNSMEKNVAPLLQLLSRSSTQFSQAMFAPLQKAYGSYPHKKAHANVRTSAGVGEQEQRFLAKRHARAKKAVEKVVGHSLTDDEVPTIALCASGGGYRAMISFLGSLEGIKKVAFLDGVMYMAGLSGGAWGVAAATMLADPLAELKSRIEKHLLTDVNPSLLAASLWRKYIFHQSLSIIDLYGDLLANRFFGGTYKNPMQLTLSEQSKKIADGSRPFPLYAAIMTKKPYEWIEFNPYEVRSAYLHAAVPTWAVNSVFKKGKSQSIDPEQSLGFFLGVSGSAFSANIEEMYQATRAQISSPVLLAALDAGTTQEMIGSTRVLPAKVHNFTFELPSSPRWQQSLLTLVDAGIDYNIPLPTVLDRADIIIIFDNSLDVIVNNASALKNAEIHAKKKKAMLPPLSYEAIVDKHCSIFFDKKNSDAPLIIYFPLINNTSYSATFDVQQCMEASYCATQNFVYSSQEIEQLAGLTRHNFIESFPMIKQAIKEYIALKRRAAGQGKA